MTRLLHRCQSVLLTALLLLAGCHQQAAPPAPRDRLQSGKNAASANARVVTAQAFRIQDGDSFIARLPDGSRLTVRLSGIDAPERSQPHADQSRQNLQRLLQGRSLQIHIAKKDQYGRAVAQVFAMAGDQAGDGPSEDRPVARQADTADVDVGLAQMERGLAWFYHRHRRDLPPHWREVYANAEQAARRAGRGLWQAPDAQPPWDFRSSRRATPDSDRR